MSSPVVRWPGDGGTLGSHQKAVKGRTESAEASVCQCRTDMNEGERCSGRASSKAADREHAAEHLEGMAAGRACLPQGPATAGKLGVNQPRPGNSELAV